jgi:general secretion pathway protein H
VRWEPRADVAAAQDFRFVGLPAANDLPQHWLNEGVTAEIAGARAVVLGPEPLIPAQRIVLVLQDRRLTLATDGLGPFEVANE